MWSSGITRCRPARSRQSCTNRADGAASTTARPASWRLRRDSSSTPMSMMAAGLPPRSSEPSSPAQENVWTTRWVSWSSLFAKNFSKTSMYLLSGWYAFHICASMLRYLASNSSQLWGARAVCGPAASRLDHGTILTSASPSALTLLPKRSTASWRGSEASTAGSLMATLMPGEASLRPSVHTFSWPTGLKPACCILRLPHS
mmetsp:Transcript_7020/g.19850  ORF Transcript_7020/g.19850 Transcript_7020/m.19850 type:complete len:202 (+) Transcript_7020:1116-1721(+)